MRENRATGGMEYEDVTSFKVKRTEQGTTNERNDELIPGLPNEIAILCIARVPRSYHRDVSKVCQSWRKLVQGRVFLKVRRELSLAEEWLYLWTISDNAWRCFDPSLKKWWKLPANSHENRIPGSSAFASLDGKLFVIGGGLLNTEQGYIPSKTVSYFDARDHCWKRAADLNIGRARCMTGVINNQLYVCGGEIERSVRGSTTITAEMYDPITDTWKLISSMKNCMHMRDSVVMGGQFYAIGLQLNGLVYDTQTDKWEELPHELLRSWGAKATVLNGELYAAVGMDYISGNLEYENRAQPGYPDSEDDEPDNYEADQTIQVYNPSKDIWEVVDQSWVVLDLSFGIEMRDVELISFDGKLCVISVETYGGKTEIRMVILEVQDSTENHTCFVIFRRNFKVELLDEPIPMVYDIKRCQVIAL